MDAPGARVSSHLFSPGAEQIARKFKRLGHIENDDRLVAWEKVKGRDNRMYHVGEGDSNLRKIDKHLHRRKSENSNKTIFS